MPTFSTEQSPDQPRYKFRDKSKHSAIMTVRISITALIFAFAGTALWAASTPLLAVTEAGALAAQPTPDQDFWQRGFQEGMMGALRDLENNRRPDPANRDEYRHPPAPYQMQDMYRQAFRRGYFAAVSKLTGTDFRSWIGGPGGQVRQQGFREGVAGAIKDFGNHRRPDPDNRDEFRHPPVPYAAQDAYRDGFQRGYRWGMSQLMGGPRGH
jgi:hypothetical protein